MTRAQTIAAAKARPLYWLARDADAKAGRRYDRIRYARLASNARANVYRKALRAAVGAK
jgi:hypothetical protein